MKKAKCIYRDSDPLWVKYQVFLKWKATLVVSYVLHRCWIETNEWSAGVWRWVEYPIYNAEIDLFEIRGVGLMGGDKVYSTVESYWFASKKECKNMQKKLNANEL